MKDLLDDLDRWRREQVRVALARVVELDEAGAGHGPAAPGSAMAVNERGEVVGSVSGGCVEPAVVAEALAVLQIGRPKLVTFGYSDDQAYSVGLTCGGRIHIFLEPLNW
jgi:xanthine dehydrogenase accessory factor